MDSTNPDCTGLDEFPALFSEMRSVGFIRLLIGSCDIKKKNLKNTWYISKTGRDGQNKNYMNNVR